ncbi:cytosine methyltransferase [Paenibacillus sp. LK1]|nr:cytosine methyltransferase [Paenibacillus sp. LK1]
MKLIPDVSVDMILCDLPYGTTQNKWDSIIDLERLWIQYERIIKDDGAIVLTAQTPFDKVLGSSNLKLLKYEWIWEKNKATGHLNAKKMPMKAHENVLVFYKNLPIYNPQGLVEKDKPTINKGDRGKKSEGAGGTNYGKSDKDAIQTHTGYPRSVQRFGVDMKPIHPTQKPLELFEFLMLTYTNENSIILDNCMGSGTTAVAALKNNRRFIGFETESKYIELANQRIESTYDELVDICF